MKLVAALQFTLWAIVTLALAVGMLLTWPIVKDEKP